MEEMSRKLHSERGASLLMALVFFLVCGFVGAVVLGSATTNAQKIQGRQADLQDYYAVSSAARLMRDALEGAACQGREHWDDYGCLGVTGVTFVDARCREEKRDDGFTGTEHFDGKLAEMLRQEGERVYQSGLLYAQAVPFSKQTRTFRVEAAGMDPVEVSMTMDQRYDVTMILQCGDYVVTLLCKAQVTGPVETTEELTCTHTVEIEDATSFETVSAERTFRGTRHIRTTTVVWERGTVTKGVPTYA